MTRRPRRVGPDPTFRANWVFAIFALLGIFFIGVLVDLQAVRPDRYRELGLDQVVRNREIVSYRGSVLDREGFVLAASTPSHQVIADPQLVEDPAETAALLAPILDIPAEDLVVDLTASSDTDRYGLLARKIGPEARDTIRDMAEDEDFDLVLRGVFLNPEEDRIYPAKNLARGVVGGVDTEENGIYGVEGTYDELLSSEAGLERIQRGIYGNIPSVGRRVVEAPIPGVDVVLTIDHRIQFMTEQILADHCARAGTRSANAVVSDPSTGEILAMATVVANGEGKCVVPKYNAPIIDAYEPGSVMKVVPLAAAVEELGYTAESIIDVPDRIKVGDKTFIDHPPHPDTQFTLAEIAAQSSNVGTIQMSLELGADRFYAWTQAFGFSQPTGLQMANEASGVVREPKDWWGSDAGSIAIGQSVTVNTVQLSSAYNAVANQGLMAKPRLVRHIVSATGEVKPAEPSETVRVFSPNTADELIKMFTRVVSPDGTAPLAAVDGYTVAGKTGTSWKAFDDGSGQLSYGSDGNRRYSATFAGMLPAEDPGLVVVVVMDEPVTNTTAGTVAAPVFAEIAQYAVRVLGIAPANRRGSVIFAAFDAAGANSPILTSTQPHKVRASQAPYPGIPGGPGEIVEEPIDPPLPKLPGLPWIDESTGASRPADN